MGGWGDREFSGGEYTCNPKMNKKSHPSWTGGALWQLRDVCNPLEVVVARVAEMRGAETEENRHRAAVAA